ncbi:MAG: M16 family metallopeptidase [Bryobacteraceae bacterium]
MRSLVVPAAILFLLAPLFGQTASIEIPYQKFVLSNGLTLLVHEDRKAPIVSVNIWYHVGSKNEKRGKTGFAHLFEHLMFNGSEHFNSDYFNVLEKIGATNLNGTTNNDRTNYFQDVPVSALDTVLWMESDRMGHLLGAIDQAKLDEQRGVVQNEKRQGENQPYGMVDEVSAPSIYPAAHPYSWTVIGSMEDLNAATLDDVREWFRTYYGPSNAVLVVAGDIDAKTAREKVERYFGSFPPGPPVAKHDAWVVKRTGSQRQVLQDRVPQARIYKEWNIPQIFTRDAAYLDLISSILGEGKVSRLYKRLVYDDQLCTDASAFVDLREISGEFVVVATARPGVDLAKVDAAMDEEIAKFLEGGPTQQELDREKTRYTAGFLRGVERIGGFGGKSDVLARGEVYAGNAEAYKQDLQTVQSATTADLKAAAVRWLSDGVYALEVVPFPDYKPDAADVDRSKVPEPGAAPEPRLPKLQRAALSNGLKIILAERHDVPLVNFSLLVDAGYAADQLARPGTARLAMNMIDEGTATRSSLQISEEMDRLGAQLVSGANLDQCTLRLNALKANLDPSLAVYADVILNPSFPEADFAREQKLQLATIQREKVTPNGIRNRVLPMILYGSGHAYGNPGAGLGTEASVSSLRREDLVKFHQSWFKPGNATLVVVGDTTLADITSKLEKLFQGWKPGEVPTKSVAGVARASKPVIYIVDRPGSIQSVVTAGMIAPQKANPNEIGIEVLDQILGGAFISRINMNLREDKHWTYGARTALAASRGPRIYMATSPVQADKTAETIAEINKELRQVLAERPVTANELAMGRDSLTLSLAGQFETMGAVSGGIAEIVQFGLPDDYFQTYTGKVRALTQKDMAAAASSLIHPDSVAWIVVGDRAKIEEPIRKLNLGEVRLIDANGNPAK